MDKNETNQLKQKELSLYNSLKQKTHPLFKNSKVNSCRYISLKYGNPKAITYDFVDKTKERKKVKNLKTNQSTYQVDYIIKPSLHCGMTCKPLVAYSIDSYRNRLPGDVFKIPRTNASCVDLKFDPSKKQWVSTYKDYFTEQVNTYISNNQILSDKVRRIHKKINDI